MRRSRLRGPHVVLSLVVLAGLVIFVRRGAADAPLGRYTIANGGMPTGTVLDNKTGLTWQQVVPAQYFSWAAAGTYCSSNVAGLPGAQWRLPSWQELETIVDDTQPNPPHIDLNAFPGAPADYFWTSSPRVGVAGAAWVVLIDGTTGYIPGTSMERARCVR